MDRIRRWLLFVAILLSGAAGLMYQVGWTRRLTSITSVSMSAQALVLTVFMAGLGLGSFLAGRLSRRLRRPVLGYVLAEVAAALLAVLSFPLMGASDGLRTALAGVGVPLDSGLWIQLAAVALVLMVPTTLMGASLPLLIEHLERGATVGTPSSRGRIVSALYGVNTLGAVLGSALAGFWTIELLGLTRTGVAGAALTLGAVGLAAASTGLRSGPLPSAPTPAEPKDRVEPRLLLAAALAGFVGLAAEVLWIRLIALIVPNTVYAFTQVLIAVLVGIVAGAAIAGLATRRWAQDGTLAASVVQFAGLSAALAAVLMALLPLLVVYLGGEVPLQEALAAGRSLLPALAMLSALVPASALIAAILPLLPSASRVPNSAGAFGTLYAANTFGCVIGSLAAGFLLIPGLGLRGAGAVVEGVALLLAAILLPIRRGRVAGVLAAAAAACLLLTFSHDIPRQIYETRLEPGARILEFIEGAESHVMVTEEQGGGRRLWINSLWVAGTGGPHRAFGHLPALFLENPRQAAGIALGTGQSFAAVLQHGAIHFDCAELNEGVIRLSRRWFKEANAGLLDDPRVAIHVGDGRSFLRTTDRRYELIQLEPLEAWSAGTSNLYSKEFYQDARRALAPGGVVSQWIPFYGQSPEGTRTMVATGLSVFPYGSLWLARTDGVLLLSEAPFEIDFEALGRRIIDRKLQKEIAPFPAAGVEDLMAFLLLGPEGLRRWTAGAQILEDDRPFLEFEAAHQIGEFPDCTRQILATLQPHLEDSARYLRNPDGSGLDAVRNASAVRSAWVTTQVLPDDAVQARVEALEAVPKSARHIALWRALYQVEINRWLASPGVRMAGPAAARTILERAHRESEGK